CGTVFCKKACCFHYFRSLVTNGSKCHDICTKLGQDLLAVYQKTCNLFFRKSVKSAVTSEQKQLDMAKSRLQKLDQA
ncbi:Os07g0452700, partial [Oryza sativa Japonica Group]